MDQQSLKFLSELHVMGNEYKKWLTKMMGYSFNIDYRKGASNKVADALSRKLEIVEFTALFVPKWQH